MFGQQKFADINAPLNAAFTGRRPLVAVHRGTGLGCVVENTLPAVTAALRQGAEMVEIDVVESTDGEFFLFHDGYESMHFGLRENIRTMDSAQIRGLQYRWAASGSEPYGVATLAEVLSAHPEALFNVDRSWWFWPRLLPYLDRFQTPGAKVLKSPVTEEYLGLLAAHGVKYPYAPMVRSHAEVLQVLGAADVNTVGMELLPDSADHEFAAPDYVRWLHGRGIFALLNAINLSNGVPLFCGWDDETSVLTGPDAGWGRLITHGADIIQTDWPGMLVPYRNATATVRGTPAAMAAR
ncbi:glycerophosphodiester phosphodiesterase family protein [Pseudarthrobacter sp. P1]|uniref:glycerophosphodiester phosphodiesterase family protein n=1 Tax=Pseudarthrobacter sp. P1 TaxID=3418418 RepID=UPI003CF39F9C